MSPGGNVIDGRDALLAYYKTRFATGGMRHHIAVKEVHLQGNGGCGIAQFSIVSKDAKGAMHTEAGNLVAVYVDESDGWHFRLVELSIPPKDRS